MNKRLVIAVLLFGLLFDARLEGQTSRSARSLQEPASVTDLGSYVPDRECASCHQEIAESYSRVAMSKSFYEPSADTAIEEFGGFEHLLSRSFYEMALEDGGYVFRRYQLGLDGEKINHYERQVDWVVGSGNHARVYLYSNPAGELYQLPIAWYSQTGRWGMAPGYDRSDHSGLERQVKRECMFCHNAYPSTTTDGDAHWQPHLFPSDLPQGIGCQRCHGPGAAHVWLLENPEYLGEDLGIVNPSDLSPELRVDVCYQCHLQPSVALVGVRTYGRGVYSFRPGDSLAEYQPALDVSEEAKAKPERFEINHHPYRLEQSRCFQESAGALSCLSCHDPHIKVAAAERASFYDEKCLGCHQESVALTAAHGDTLPGDCTSCHMPDRTPTDVIHVTMTDHLIQRPGAVQIHHPEEEVDPILVDAHYLYPRLTPSKPLAEAYRASAVIRAGGRYAGAAVERLEEILSAPMAAPSSWPLEPRLDLAKGQLLLHDFGALERTAMEILEQFPEFPRALEWLAIVGNARGDHQQAMAYLDRALELDPGRIEARFNRALFLAEAGQLEAAISALEEVVEQRPEFASAWFQLGRMEAQREDPRRAVSRYRRALEINPRNGRAYVGLAESLVAVGERQAAEQLLLHAGRVVTDRAPIFESLRALSAQRPNSK